MPFLRLTRDRRGFENTFLLHADRPGERPRLLYWYRTAPGILLGRAPLDEDAIRTIEDQHPGIDFDWAAILALSEVMTPEDEAPAARRERKSKPPRQREPSPARQADPPPDARSLAAANADDATGAAADADQATRAADDSDYADQGNARTAPEAPAFPDDAEPDSPREEARRLGTYGLLEELVGREIATRLRARYSEIGARIHELHAEAAVRDAWLKRAEAMNPDLWLTPEAILDGVRSADGLFERLRRELLGHFSRE